LKKKIFLFRTSHLGGNRELAMRFDDIAYNRSAGKAVNKFFFF
jgi:hypothetical protein